MKEGRTVEEQYDAILDTYLAIPLDGSITMLTGSNGSGKSLIRQQLPFRTKKLGGKIVAHASMALRTGLHSDLGGAGVFLRDTDWDPTSVNTIYFIQTAARSIHGGYLVLDEIEVGCAEETIMGMVVWLNANLRAAIKDTLGCMVITHSRHVVENLKFDHWFNLDGYKTPEEWLNRKIVPVDLEKVRKDSRDLFKFVSAHSKEK